jgi:hypothetical protein
MITRAQINSRLPPTHSLRTKNLGILKKNMLKNVKKKQPEKNEPFPEVAGNSP